MKTPADESQYVKYKLFKHEQLIELVLKLEQITAHDSAEINRLNTIILMMNQRMFGRKSEAHPNPNQGDLFIQQDGNIPTLEQNQSTETTIEPETKLTQTKNKNKPVAIKPGRKQLPESLPRETRVIDLEDKSCQQCQAEMKFIGEAISEKLNYIPAVLNVIRTIRKKYACQCCQCIAVPAMPAEIIDKGIPTNNLLTEVISKKFIYHMPLYRQQQMFKSMGVDIPINTLCDWVAAVAKALEPLADELKQRLLAESVIHADETTLKILDKGQKKKVINGYVWAYATSFHSENKIIYYHCANSRSGEHAIEILGDYTGTLVVDDYSGYKALFNSKPIIEAGCMTHVRRKFVEFIKTGHNPTAQYFINEVAKLYHIEARFKHYTAVRRKRARQWLAKPIMDKLKTWLLEKAQNMLPNTPLLKVITNALNRWPALEVYLNDGDVPIDNNHIERNIRGVALGRKNWLFAGSLAAGKHMTNILSLLATARANDINPEQWLRETLAKLPTCLNKDINELLPIKPQPNQQIKKTI